MATTNSSNEANFGMIIVLQGPCANRIQNKTVDIVNYGEGNGLSAFVYECSCKEITFAR